MPSLPPRLCSCGTIVPSGERCACQLASDRARKARHDTKRPTARQRGYTREWQRESKAFLVTYPYCVMCGIPASLVDHITPHKGDKRLFWDRSNWQPLCVFCHSSHKQREERR
jgi:5-methylcytosine-specific restriction enzyme A